MAAWTPFDSFNAWLRGAAGLVALVQEKEGVARFLRRLGEPTDAPVRAPARAPPFYRSAVIRRLTTGDLAVA